MADLVPADVAPFDPERAKDQELFRIENKLKELAEQGFTRDGSTNREECKDTLLEYYQFVLDNKPKFIEVPSDTAEVGEEILMKVEFKERDETLLEELTEVFRRPTDASELSLKGAIQVMNEKKESTKRIFAGSSIKSEELMWTVYSRVGWLLEEAKGIGGGVGGAGVARIP
jgi:hypothetical protein